MLVTCPYQMSVAQPPARKDQRLRILTAVSPSYIHKFLMRNALSRAAIILNGIADVARGGNSYCLHTPGTHRAARGVFSTQ